MIDIVKYRYDDEELFDLGRIVRTEVFIEEQQVDHDIEFEYEEESIHYLVLQDAVPVATGRWRNTGLGIKLERFAVLEEERGKGLGEAVLKRILEDVIPQEIPIYLHAQVSAMGFYAKNGFTPVGEPFYEANIEHYKMIYTG